MVKSVNFCKVSISFLAANNSKCPNLRNVSEVLITTAPCSKSTFPLYIMSLATFSPESDRESALVVGTPK